MLILASASPRRKELLGLTGRSFETAVSDADEAVGEDLPPEELVKTLALRKARAVFRYHPDDVVLGSDTIVVLGDKVMGKPHNEDEAVLMLRSLSGRKHHVFTGVAILHSGTEDVFCAVTEVEFMQLTDEEIYDYVKTGEPMDKAGAYGIQGRGATLVRGITGDYFTVVGLPVAETERHLRALEALRQV